jgi:hypothetical protein
MATRGWPEDLLNLFIGHQRPGVFGTYQASERLEDRRKVAEAWAEAISQMGAAALARRG